MGRVNTVTFDLWQTLIIDTPELGRPRARRRIQGVLDTLLAEGCHATMERLAEAYQRCLRVCEGIREAERDVTFDEQIDIFLQEIDGGLAAGLSPRARALLAHRYAHCYLEHPPRIDEGAHRVLQAVKGMGWKVGLICNTGATPGSMQRIFLEQQDLARFFDTLTFSDEERLAKPAARIFQVTLERLGAVAQESVHVGDHPLNDVDGAKRAGLRAIWLRRGGANEPRSRPDATITALEDAVAALAALDSSPAGADRPG